MELIFLDMIHTVLVIIGTIFKISSPLIIGLVLAYLLSPAVTWFEGKLKSRRVSIFITYTFAAACFCILIFGLVYLILGAIPNGGIADTLQLLLEYFEEANNAANQIISNLLPQFQTRTTDAFNIHELILTLFSLDSMIDFFSELIFGLIASFLGLVASIYLLKDKEFFLGLWEQFLSLTLKQKTHGFLSETMSQIHAVITTFLKGAFIDSLLVGFLSSIVLSALNVDYAVIIGLLGGVLNIIPYFGPFLGMVPAFLIAYFNNGLTYGLLSIMGLFLVQQIDSNFIYPKVVGDATGIHPLFVLLSVTVFGYLGGIVGMLLAVPAAGIIQVFIKKWAYSKE